MRQILVLYAAAIFLIDTNVVADDVSIEPYLAADGKEAKPEEVKVSVLPDHVHIEFAPRRGGRYRFGISVTATALAPLVPGREPLTATTLSKPLELRYPYDWTFRGQANVLNSRPRLVVPGVHANGRYYIVDTRELYSVRLEPTEHDLIRALFLKHQIFNDGGDGAKVDLDMEAGQQEELDVLVFASLKEANRVRFGTYPPMRGRMTSVMFRLWPAESLSQKEYEKIAERLQGVFNYVIVREIIPHSWIPPIFHTRGISVLHYQYWGALRRRSSQLPEGREEEIGLRDRNGELYTAPTSPHGNWLLCDIRQGDARSLFVENACAAIRAGFDGVFLDGPSFWSDALGRRGGNVPSAEQSLAHARWKLLHEMKQEIRAVRQDAVLGVLGNQYYDLLGEADFILKERMYSGWDAFDKQFQQRRTQVRQDMDVAYEIGQTVYATKNVGYGVKGYSPISVQSSLHFIHNPRELVYLGMGDFYRDRLDDWLKAIVAIATEDDLYIQTIEPSSCAIHFEGLTTIWADTECTITFSRPVCLLVDASTEYAHQAARIKLTPQRRYRIQRSCK